MAGKQFSRWNISIYNPWNNSFARNIFHTLTGFSWSTYSRISFAVLRDSSHKLPLCALETEKIKHLSCIRMKSLAARILLNSFQSKINTRNHSIQIAAWNLYHLPGIGSRVWLWMKRRIADKCEAYQLTHDDIMRLTLIFINIIL